MCNNEEVDVIKNILPVHRKFLSREKVFHRMDGAAVSRFFCDFVCFYVSLFFKKRFVSASKQFMRSCPAPLTRLD
jgi:hypothetical protein